MTRPTHRRTNLVGGPLNGCTARVYPDAPGPGTYGGTEPATLTLCLGAALPDWRPAAWVTYHRHPDGTYRWTQETPVKAPNVAADGPTEAHEGKDTRDTNGDGYSADVIRYVRGLGYSVEDIDPHALRQALTNPEHTWLKDTP